MWVNPERGRAECCPYRRFSFPLQKRDAHPNSEQGERKGMPGPGFCCIAQHCHRIAKTYYNLLRERSSDLPITVRDLTYLTRIIVSAHRGTFMLNLETFYGPNAGY